MREKNNEVFKFYCSYTDSSFKYSESNLHIVAISCHILQPPEWQSAAKLSLSTQSQSFQPL